MRGVRRMRSGFWGVVAGAILATSIVAPDHGFAQESVAGRAVMVKEGVPGEDPSAAAWNTVPVSEFPLSPQVHWPTRVGQVAVERVKVRALRDGHAPAVLLGYA